MDKNELCSENQYAVECVHLAQAVQVCSLFFICFLEKICSVHQKHLAIFILTPQFYW